jgi:uncharacterized membrane protein
MAMPKPGSQIARLGLVALFVLTWSSAFPAAKIAVHLAPIALFLGARFFVAGALLLCWAWSAGELRRGLPWFTLAWLGVLNQAGYQGLAWLGAARISAGLATIIASLSPITVACLAVPLLGERMSWRKAAGLLLGCAGAAWVVRDRVQVSGGHTGLQAGGTRGQPRRGGGRPAGRSGRVPADAERVHRKPRHGADRSRAGADLSVGNRGGVDRRVAAVVPAAEAGQRQQCQRAAFPDAAGRPADELGRAGGAAAPRTCWA